MESRGLVPAKSVNTTDESLAKRIRCKQRDVCAIRGQIHDGAIYYPGPKGPHYARTPLPAVKAGLVGRSQDWRSSSVIEYSGVSPKEQKNQPQTARPAVCATGSALLALVPISAGAGVIWSQIHFGAP